VRIAGRTEKSKLGDFRRALPLQLTGSQLSQGTGKHMEVGDHMPFVVPDKACAIAFWRVYFPLPPCPSLHQVCCVPAGSLQPIQQCVTCSSEGIGGTTADPNMLHVCWEMDDQAVDACSVVAEQ